MAAEKINESVENCLEAAYRRTQPCFQPDFQLYPRGDAAMVDGSHGGSRRERQRHYRKQEKLIGRTEKLRSRYGST